MDSGAGTARSERLLLEEQLAYYEERAGEYDDWWERRGRYDWGEEMNARWRSEISAVCDAFERIPMCGEVVELAPGTGYWTKKLVSKASRVVALDGSAAMIAMNRTRLGDLATRVDYRQVDLFEWIPSRRRDGLVFCFWISHVPRNRLAGFFDTCRRALVAGGSLFFLDGRPAIEGTAVDQTLPDPGDDVMLRRLNDGREFRVVKNFYEPAELVDVAEAAGFALEVFETDTFFQYGVGLAR